MNTKTSDGDIFVGGKNSWTTDLAEAIKNVEPGKELIVNSYIRRELALQAIRLMRPNDNISVTIQWRQM